MNITISHQSRGAAAKRLPHRNDYRYPPHVFPSYMNFHIGFDGFEFQAAENAIIRRITTISVSSTIAVHPVFLLTNHHI